MVILGCLQKLIGIDGEILAHLDGHFERDVDFGDLRCP
jgi:hypothetical protein